MDYCVPGFCRRRKSTRCAPCGGCAANTSAMPDGASMGRGRGPPSPAPHPQKQNPVVYTKVWTYLHGNTHRAPTHLTATAGWIIAIADIGWLHYLYKPVREASLFACDHFTGSKSFSLDGTFASISLAISSACADAWAAVCLGSGLKSTPTMARILPFAS